MENRHKIEIQDVIRHTREDEPLCTMEQYKSKGLTVTGPKFRGPSTLSVEQLTDPDYRLKQLGKLNGGKLKVTCSRCHHCR